MSNGEWYRRALGGGRQAPPPSPQAYAQPQQAPPNYQPPPGYRLVADEQQNGAVPWQMVANQQVPNVDTRTIPRGAVTPENFLEMAKYYKGGPGRSAAIDCPQCGGVMFRRFEGRREAAPLCESCNYNGGMFVQGQGAVAVTQ
jgi:hypothetical protein